MTTKISNYILNKYDFRIFPILLLLITFLCVSGIHAQNVGDYRSATTSGNWTSLSSWQRYDGTNWVTPTSAQGYPGEYAGTGAVSIETGHTILADFFTALPKITTQITVTGVNNVSMPEIC